MRSDADRVLVAVSGEVDLVVASSLQELLLETEAGRPDRLVLDLRRLLFMDCSGLRIVLEADARARQSGRLLTVACLPGQVRRLLTLVSADQQLDLVAHPGESRRSQAVRAVSPQLGYQARGSIAVITLPARVEADCIPALRSRCKRARDSGSRVIAVDLRALRHIDTHTLSELGMALRAISRHKAKLAIVGADPRIRLMLELCGIDGVEFHPTMKRALAAVRERRRWVKTPVWPGVLRRQHPAPHRSSARS